MISYSSSQPTNGITINISPFRKFTYALNSHESNRQYPRRFQLFLDYLQIKDMSIEDKINSFYLVVERNGTSWLETELLKFFSLQNQMAERKEISTETIKIILNQ